MFDEASLKDLNPVSPENMGFWSLIFLAALRTRSLQIAAIVGNFSFPVGSGSWTRMNRRFPPSARLLSKVACPVVPEPAKKSRTMSQVWADVLCDTASFGTETGLGKGNIFSPKRASRSRVPSVVNPRSCTEENPVTSFFSSFRNRFKRGRPVSEAGQRIRRSSIRRFIVDGSYAQPRLLSGGYEISVSGFTIS